MAPPSSLKSSVYLSDCKFHTHYFEFLVFNPNMTQVATIQPGPNSRGQPNTQDWGSGLFSCFQDVSGCLFGAICPCILLCNISNRLDEGYLFPCCCGNVAPLALRAKVRYEGNIQGSLCNDALVAMCFGSCALCQMDRELKAAGK